MNGREVIFTMFCNIGELTWFDGRLFPFTFVPITAFIPTTTKPSTFRINCVDLYTYTLLERIRAYVPLQATELHKAHCFDLTGRQMGRNGNICSTINNCQRSLFVPKLALTPLVTTPTIIVKQKTPWNKNIPSILFYLCTCRNQLISIFVTKQPNIIISVLHSYLSYTIKSIFIKNLLTTIQNSKDSCNNSKTNSVHFPN